ncbi:hypothetical protein [Nocardioides sp. GXZ039]|uniref:hypothetical protein n=1 Tax=Nocardioides sp. GXZ039 TaxID=3136018 RepID=UPI0030F42656
MTVEASLFPADTVGPEVAAEAAEDALERVDFKAETVAVAVERDQFDNGKVRILVLVDSARDSASVTYDAAGRFKAVN